MATKLIVGLGNPGEQYAKTRHNAGFMVLDQLVKTLSLNFNENKFSGTFCKTTINQQPVFFAKPLTYMNLSGDFVRSFCDFYKIWSQHILVVHDELAFQIGHYRLKARGSGGGHNGMQNIINRMGTEKIKRLRIGINNQTRFDIAKYVLNNFLPEEQIKLDTAIANATIACYEFINCESFDLLMNKFNNN